MYEIEIKAYCDTISEVENQIVALGAKDKKEIFQHDIYFNHPSRDFKETDEAFRIRTVNGKQKITYKGPKVSTAKAKTREELETDIGDFDTAHAVFVKLGFKESGSVKKKRTEYSLDGVTICLDQVDGLGDFVELEKIGSEVAQIEKELFSLAEKLGLHKFEKRSYLHLVLGE